MSILAGESIRFSVEIVNYCKWLTNEKSEYVLSKQLLRSGTSIGANIHEANYAISRADFIAKMQIALKEAAETEYWITILKQTGYFENHHEKICEDLRSIKRMLIATLKTAKKS